MTTPSPEEGRDRQAALIADLAQQARQVAAQGGPQRIRLSRARGWRLPENAVSVARPTPWGNPFVVGRDGARADCVALHALLLDGFTCLSGPAGVAVQRACRAHADAHLSDLTGRDLACWCSLDGPCHADALLIAANSPALRLALTGARDDQG